ncbi:MAG: flagellar motor switch protein FliG [Porphyrobacter sp.]|nr:flagellar motor switch protein FliG [Porphyrobacter sp.]
MSEDVLDRLPDAERAAILVMLLEEEDAAGLLSRLSPEELQQLGSKMFGLGELGPKAITDALAGFAESASQGGLPAQDRSEDVRRIMTGAVGELKASNLMRRIAPEASQQSPTLELARWLNADVIISLIEEEHPQAIAVLLLQLDPQVAAQVLAGLPEAVQAPVIQRVARLEPIAPEALVMLEEMLSTRISTNHGRVPLSMGGVREAAEIINAAAKAVEKRVMPEITKIDKKLAKELENEMFKFEHLFKLDAKTMGQLLREVENEVLIDALKGITDEEREPFFAAMSARAADGVRDEIEARGRVKKADALTAQQSVIATAKRLAAEGTISLGDGGDEYV